MPSVSQKPEHSRRDSSPQIEGLVAEGEMEEISIVNNETTHVPGETEEDTGERSMTIKTTDDGMADLTKKVLADYQKSVAKSQTTPTKNDNDTDDIMENPQMTNTDQGISALAWKLMNDALPAYHTVSMETQTQTQTPTPTSSKTPSIPTSTYTTDNGMQQLTQDVLRGKPAMVPPSKPTLTPSSTTTYTPSGNTRGATKTSKVESSQETILLDHAKANDAMLKQLNGKIESPRATPSGPINDSIGERIVSKPQYSIVSSADNTAVYRSSAPIDFNEDSKVVRKVPSYQSKYVDMEPGATE